MPNPVHNDGNNANANIGRNSGGNANAPGSTNISNRQSQNIFRQVNDNLGKNPNHSNRTEQGSNSNKSASNAANSQINKTGGGEINGLNNLVERIITEVFRQNDVYLDSKILKNTINDKHPDKTNDSNKNNAGKSNAPGNKELGKLIDNIRSLLENILPDQKKNEDKLLEKAAGKQGQKPSNLLTDDAADLLRYVKEQIFALLGDSQETGDKQIQKIARELSRQFHEQIETSKNIFTRGTDSGAKTFNQLNITERMQAAIKILLSELPSEIAGKLKNYQPEEILSGLLLARGLVEGRENAANLRNLLSFQPPILPEDISLKDLRNIGQIVKILISAAASAKTSENLDLAVQKFLRLLLANNEVGALLAAVQLASQTQNPKVSVSRSLALVQIYELIARLTATGEKAMKNQLAGGASRHILQTNGKGELASAGVIKTAERGEQMLNGLKSQLSGAESALRQFLEFNPMAASDNSASAFDSFDDASRAQRDFISIYQDDIDNWLKSGTHRFVKEIELENPIGVVTERDSENVSESAKVRIVLVRDGSVVGWHFLKSFLVG